MLFPGLFVAKWNRLPQGVRFILIGGWNTVFGLGVFAVLHFLLIAHCHYLILLLVANELAVINSYFFHKLAVFTESGGITFFEVVRFHSVYLVSILLGMGLTYGQVEIMAFHPIAAQAITTIGVVIVSYFAHTSYSFGKNMDK